MNTNYGTEDLRAELSGSATAATDRLAAELRDLTVADERPPFIHRSEPTGAVAKVEESSPVSPTHDLSPKAISFLIMSSIRRHTSSEA